MASALFSSIQFLSTYLLEAIRGTPSTSHHQDPPVTDQQKSVREHLEKLSRKLRRIRALLKDAEEREIHDESVQLWLAELRGVGYQAEDVLDEFYYEVLRSIVEGGDDAIEAYYRDGGTKRKYAEMYASSSHASYSFTNITKASIPDDMAEKIKGITERFEEISNDRMVLQLREEDGTRLIVGPHIRPPTSSHVDERAIFGREEEKEKIIGLLNLSNSPDFMVLPIVGMGGVGKTTLAQLVYSDSRICWLFNKRCWVSVSEDFDLVRLTKSIVESVSNGPCQFAELSKLQDVLKEMIKDLDLFLVLDDVWNDNKDLWERFRVGFLGAKVVRILMTTRNTSVAKITQTTSLFKLDSLHEENCWLLFKHFAFGNREASENANLNEIGRGIVKKCKGSPLAIKALGCLLIYEMDEEKWREILESDISEIDETQIMPALRLSYQKLPRHLKPCFLYLSMFPKGTHFGKDMVVRLWMAQGYINGNITNLKTLEEIGSEYFDELHGRSLVDCGLYTEYLLHDLIHDLARTISEEAHVLKNDQHCNDLFKVYHVYLTKEDQLLDSSLPPSNYWSIRTLVEECWTENFEFAIFSKIARVRALQVSYSMLPNKLGMLKHLRYLSIENSYMGTLPESLCLLYNLQTLDLYFDILREIPENIKNLINLRYFKLRSGRIQQLPESIFRLRNLNTLSLKNCANLKELPRGIEQLNRLRILDLPLSHLNMPAGIGKLTALKPLSGHFSVMDDGMIGGLGELKDMNKLSGLLCISGLRNIRDAEYSRNANLESKSNLHRLNLNFQEDRILSCKDNKTHLHLVVSSSKNARNENDEEIHDVVLQSLQPHANLTELAILKYVGQIFPPWLLNALLPKLTTLTLNFWTEPNFLPSFGQLPNLKYLDISGNTGVKNVGDELNTYSLLAEYGSSMQPKEPSYPSLEVLSLWNMLNFVECQAHDGDFPCLKKLTIKNCPKLWKIAIIPQEVGEVTFKYCPKLKLLTCPSVIKRLMIHKCGFSEIIFGPISESLIISKCIELVSINWMDKDLNFVRAVSLQYCPKLQLHVPVLLSMTQRAEIYYCPKLYLGKRYVYQRDTTIEEFHLSGNNEILLPDSTIPFLGNHFTLILTKEDFLEVESLSCAPPVGVSCQCIMLNLSSLVILEILRCRKVISVTGLHSLSNLRHLSISYCPKLCNWNDKTLPVSLMFLELNSCNKLCSLPFLSVQNHSSNLSVLVIKECPRLAVLEGFHGLLKLITVELLHCRTISISPANESLQFRPYIFISDCPLMRDWCQRNSITYNELSDNPQDHRESISASDQRDSTQQESAEEINLDIIDSTSTFESWF